MDTALNAAAAVAGLLSLTVQVVQATHQHVSCAAAPPAAAKAYLAELMCVKHLLADAQDVLLLQPESLDADLPREFVRFQVDLEELCSRLQSTQRSSVAETLKNIAWPFRDDEMAQWAASLSRCRLRLQAALTISGLRLQMTTLDEVRSMVYHGEVRAQEGAKLKILNWVSDDKMRQKHATLVSSLHPGSGEWVLKTPEFQDWRAGKAPVLWCSGGRALTVGMAASTAGVGKTNITALIAETISPTSPTAYFYCHHQDHGAQTVVAIAASILRQFLEAGPSLPPALERLYRMLRNGQGQLKLDDITTLLQRLCQEKGSTYVLIDALDECGRVSQRQRVMSLLRALVDAGVKVFITSRLHVAHDGRMLPHSLRLHIRSHPSDILSYVRHRISTCGELAALVDEGMEDEVIQQVTKQANRMFLLAALQCDYLTRLARRSEVRVALRGLPAGLEMAYEESMRRIAELESPERKSLAMATISWVYHAKRPLSIGELQHALVAAALLPASEWNAEDVPPSSIILDVCVGLVGLDEENGDVRFAHHSVQEYFQATAPRWFPLGRADITRACFTYLGRMGDVTMLTLSSRSRSSSSNSGNPLTHRSVAHILSTYPFLLYAAQHWGRHARDAFDVEDVGEIALRFLSDGDRVELAARLLDYRNEMGKRDSPRMRPCANLALQLAARFGVLGVVRWLLRRGHSASAVDASGRTALHWAARGGFTGVIGALLDAGGGGGGVELEPDAGASGGLTPLHWAAKHGHVDAVAELMRRGANPARRTVDGRSALHWAASRGYHHVVEHLLADGRVDASCQSNDGWTALHWAACSGSRAAVVARGAGTGAGVGTAAGDGAGVGSNAGERCVSISGGEPNGHVRVVALLLGAGVCPHMRNEKCQTALHWAAASGNGAIISMLRDHGADMDARDSLGMSPLDFAVENGADDSVVSMFPAVV